MSYFAEPDHSKNEIKTDLDLPNYATKADLKNATVVNISDFQKKAGLASLKLDVHRLGIDKSKSTSVGLRQLSNVASKKVVKKTEYKGLVKKVNAIQTIYASDLAQKFDYNTKID